MHCHLFKVIMELIVVFTIDGRKLCTGSRDNWMCLWDIESAKCEHRRNISRNLVSLLVYFFYLTVCLPMHTYLLAFFLSSLSRSLMCVGCQVAPLLSRPLRIK